MTPTSSGYEHFFLSEMALGGKKAVAVSDPVLRATVALATLA